MAEVRILTRHNVIQSGGQLLPFFMLICNNYSSAGSVAIVGQPATLPVLGPIVPTVYSHLSHPIIPVDGSSSGAVAADFTGFVELYCGSRAEGRGCEPRNNPRGASAAKTITIAKVMVKVADRFSGQDG